MKNPAWWAGLIFVPGRLVTTLWERVLPVPANFKKVTAAR